MFVQGLGVTVALYEHSACGSGFAEVKTAVPLSLPSRVLTRKTESTELLTGVTEQLRKQLKETIYVGLRFEKGQSMVGKDSTVKREAKGDAMDRTVGRAACGLQEHPPSACSTSVL